METRPRELELSVAEAYNYLKNGTLLLDVRENEEVQELIFDLPNVLYIPLSQLEQRFDEVPQNAEIIIACKGGNRSHVAAHFLMQKGYEEIIHLKGGIDNWVRKGFPTKGDTSSILVEAAAAMD